MVSIRLRTLPATRDDSSSLHQVLKSRSVIHCHYCPRQRFEAKQGRASNMLSQQIKVQGDAPQSPLYASSDSTERRNRAFTTGKVNMQEATAALLNVIFSLIRWVCTSANNRMWTKHRYQHPFIPFLTGAGRDGVVVQRRFQTS